MLYSSSMASCDTRQCHLGVGTSSGEREFTLRPSSTTKSRPRGPNSSRSTAASGSAPDSWSSGRMLEHSSGRCSCSSTACSRCQCVTSPNHILSLSRRWHRGHSIVITAHRLYSVEPSTSSGAPGMHKLLRMRKAIRMVPLKYWLRGQCGRQPSRAPGRWRRRACARRRCAASWTCPTGSPRTASAAPCSPA